MHHLLLLNYINGIKSHLHWKEIVLTKSLPPDNEAIKLKLLEQVHLQEKMRMKENAVTDYFMRRNVFC